MLGLTEIEGRLLDQKRNEHLYSFFHIDILADQEYFLHQAGYILDHHGLSITDHLQQLGGVLFHDVGGELGEVFVNGSDHGHNIVCFRPESAPYRLVHLTYEDLVQIRRVLEVVKGDLGDHLRSFILHCGFVKFYKMAKIQIKLLN